MLHAKRTVCVLPRRDMRTRLVFQEKKIKIDYTMKDGKICASLALVLTLCCADVCQGAKKFSGYCVGL